MKKKEREYVVITESSHENVFNMATRYQELRRLRAAEALKEEPSELTLEAK